MVKANLSRMDCRVKPVIQNRPVCDTYPINLIEEMTGESCNEEDPDSLWGSMEYPFDSIPEDITGTVEYLIARIPKEITREMVMLRYKYGMTLTDMEAVFGVTKERIRQIIAKGLRMMRTREGMKYIRYGISGYNQILINRMVSSRISSIREELMQDVLRKLENRGYSLKQIAEATEAVMPGTGITAAQEVRLEELSLSVRSFNCLRRAGCINVADVVKLGHGIYKVRNLGRRSLDEITAKLVSLGYDEHELWTEE